MSTAVNRYKSRGQAMAELALLIPLIAMALISLVDFGMVLLAHIQVTNAAREAARAASLYHQTRYSYVDVNGSITACSTGIDAWSVQQTAEEAVVAHSLTNKGCPDSSGSVTATSLGWLPVKPTPTSWSLSISPSWTSNAMPTAGDRATVTLTYPYRLLILSNFVPALQDPIWITKSVEFEYQN